ncbi:hypothetical protein H3S75_12500 [Gilliamella sp. B14384G15]|uniref:hypothetical protein n=1 Tax=unclassified Gilliamella TaxID=2685620 RepID=UPI0018DB7D22|nr:MULTISPECIES: hypothetical protein [unclassified Gilliamella]MBI0032056.1 hypothetical protein [Gilliamella sp. B14384G15]MBI0059404.1 hypothetical protein [Gilliamella sp. B14384G12]
MKYYKLSTQKKWQYWQQSVSENHLVRYNFIDLSRTQLQESSFEKARFDYSSA